MPTPYRVGLILAVTVAILFLAEGLSSYVTAGKLLSLDTPQAARDAYRDRIWSWICFVMSFASLAVFILLRVRASSVVRRAQDLTNR